MLRLQESTATGEIIQCFVNVYPISILTTCILLLLLDTFLRSLFAFCFFVHWLDGIWPQLTEQYWHVSIETGPNKKMLLSRLAGWVRSCVGGWIDGLLVIFQLCSTYTLSRCCLWTFKVLTFWNLTWKWSGWISWQLLWLKTYMVKHGGSSAGSYPADPTSPIPSHCVVIILFKSVTMHQLSWLAL